MADKRQSSKEKPAKEAGETSKKATPSGKGSEDSQKQVLDLLAQMKAKLDKSDETLSSVVQRISDLENQEYVEDYGPYQFDSYEEECMPEWGSGCEKRPLDWDGNNNETVVDSRFSSLAKRFKGQEVTDCELDPILASNVTDLFRKGMEDDQYSDLIKDNKLLRPANCEGLTVVKCNQLVWDLISPSARTNDKKLQNVETPIVKAATILAKMVDKTAKIEKELKEKGNEDISFIVDSSTDVIALLGHANRQINLLRKDLLRPELKNEYSHLCNHTVPFTSQLFGDDVSKAAKEIEDAAKIGNKMQYGQYRGAYRGTRGSFRGRARMRPWSRGFGRGRYFSGPPSHTQTSGDSKNPPKRGGLRFPMKN